MDLFKGGETYVPSGVGDYLKGLQVRYNIDSALGKLWKNREETPERISFVVRDRHGVEKRVTLKQRKIEVFGWVCETIKDEPRDLPNLKGVFDR